MSMFKDESKFESMEAKALKQNIVYLIEQAYHKGLTRGYNLGYHMGQTEKTNYSIIQGLPKESRALLEFEEVRMNYQWQREGF